MCKLSTSAHIKWLTGDTAHRASPFAFAKPCRSPPVSTPKAVCDSPSCGLCYQGKSNARDASGSPRTSELIIMSHFPGKFSASQVICSYLYTNVGKVIMSDVRGKRKLVETALSQRKGTHILWISRSRLRQATGLDISGPSASESLSNHTRWDPTYFTFAKRALNFSYLSFSSYLRFERQGVRYFKDDPSLPCLSPSPSPFCPFLHFLLLQITQFRSPRITDLQAVVCW